MAQGLGFVFAGASTVLGLAMLPPVIWQAPRHRHNRFMAVSLATLVFWGGSHLSARQASMPTSRQRSRSPFIARWPGWRLPRPSATRRGYSIRNSRAMVRAAA